MRQSIKHVKPFGAAVASDAQNPRPRITELLRIARSALSAAAVCSPMLVAAHPRTPLRVLCIAAFEYLARLRNGTLGSRRRSAVALACDFGSVCDDYYDHQKLDRAEYRSLRRALRRMAPEAEITRYIQQLRKAERGRPNISSEMPGLAEATIDYRRSVIELSLRWLQGICGFTDERVSFHSMVSLVCLMQLADDLIDWKEDQAERSPTYVTAFLREQPNTSIATRLRAQAEVLLESTQSAARHDVAAVPFAMAGMATWMFVIVLLKVRLPR